MKKFEIPEFYRSPIISRVKAAQKNQDPRKKDFSPTLLDFGKVRFLIARHFGFCYGVENAIEISYRALAENPHKRIFLLSQMIHNPEVNADLVNHGIQFIQDTDGTQLIPWDELNAADVVIIPAFGTTLEIEKILNEKGVDTKVYNTTCPFVEKVWNRSEKLGADKHTIIIHGKYNHEETRATFSHSIANAPSLIIKDMSEARILGGYILGNISEVEFLEKFENKYSSDFNPAKNLTRIGVVNQTTMLASETQEISEYLRSVMITKYGEDNIKNHIADTRDTLCYATNDNQTATIGLMQHQADFAIVVGGYNSSNTTHLVELLETKFPTYFIKSEKEIKSLEEIEYYDIHTGSIRIKANYLDINTPPLTIAITSGASCPDSIIDGVLRKFIDLLEVKADIDEVINNIV